MLYKQGWSFGAITDPFLSQVLSLSVLILTVSPVLRVSGSIAILAVEDLVCGLAEGRLVQIGWLNNLWAGDNPFLSGWEFKNSIDK